jgi:exodeoxyribonuclease-3
MQEPCTLLTWNVRQGGKDKPAIADSITRLAPTVAVLTEYRGPTPIRGCLRGELEALGWPFVYTSDPPGRDNGILVASRVPLVLGDIPIGPRHMQHRWLHVKSPKHNLELGCVYVPTNILAVKEPYWQWLVETARVLADRNAVLLGDFNTGLFGRWMKEPVRSFASPISESSSQRVGWTPFGVSTGKRRPIAGGATEGMAFGLTICS